MLSLPTTILTQKTKIYNTFLKNNLKNHVFFCKKLGLLSAFFAYSSKRRERIRKNLFRKELIFMDMDHKSPDITLLQDVYKAVGMGTNAVLTILGKAKEEDMRAELTALLDGYQKFAAIARNRLSSLSVSAEDAGMIEKLPEELSIHMAAFTDDSSSKLAELMIGDSARGVSSCKRISMPPKKRGPRRQTSKSRMTFRPFSRTASTR